MAAVGKVGLTGGRNFAPGATSIIPASIHKLAYVLDCANRTTNSVHDCTHESNESRPSTKLSVIKKNANLR